jgi:Family of unknown function (DUF6298)
MSARLTSSLAILLAACGLATAAEPRHVAPGPDGRLIYDADARGNRVPDFSHCGYNGGGVAIPDVPVRVRVPVLPGDATASIQAALDHVAKLPADERGLRGAVLVEAGRHDIAGQLRIATGGVVLRGQGVDATVLVATGTDRRTLIQIAGRDGRRPAARTFAVADAYVPVGANKLRLSGTPGLQVGATISVEHPSTATWVSALKMDQFGGKESGWLGWRPGKMDVRWDRTVTAVDGETITLDAPLTLALDASLGQAKVVPYSWPGRIAQVGVENLRCESAYDRGNRKDEQHAWMAVALDNVRDAWVRQVTARHFVSSAVAVGAGCRSVTVEDCRSLDPVSETAAYRRHAFYTAGQLTLFQRCRSEHGRHDFAVGYLAAGPNAFVECEAVDASAFSGPIESWASGVLYDCVTMDGGGLSLTNREIAGQGVGWAAANCVLWQCTAPVVTCRNPPTAQNWAIGCWGQFVGDGHFRSCNEFVKPQSLYRAQLADRLGEAAVRATGRREIPADPARAPTIESSSSVAGVTDPGPRVQRTRGPASLRPATEEVAARNGWLVRGGSLLSGGRTETAWWRGSIVPGRTGESGPAITRFAPGRTGPGATDDLDALTDSLRANGTAVFEHHYGLWYDRRRDDHQMIRRIDGEVWPPFFEQPWARSGAGTAWDGLSKYDLTRFNPWYFARLKQFADLGAKKGVVLVHEMYFQHNILEAGAHWADCPWRPANCLQATGFPEPPPYENNKRVFMADAYYDVTHPVRRELHRAYIRQCLDALAGHQNVIHLTSAEFTGPLHFVQFWLDVVREWKVETGKRVLIGLSATKDVQDAILPDSVRAAAVDVIDIRYWWYTAGGSLYAPRGGENLAPRQQLREWRGDRKQTPESMARAVREYRRRYPDKVILCSLDRPDGWAVLAAGGSVPQLPRTVDSALLATVPTMRPFEPPGLTGRQWALADPGRGYLVYSAAGDRVRLDLTGDDTMYLARRVNVRTGRAEDANETVRGGRVVEVAPPGDGAWVLWLAVAKNRD